jgi:DNA-binding CsgD family transcriptional regulator
MSTRRSGTVPSPTVIAEDLLASIAVIRRRSVYIARDDSPDPHLTTAQIELLRLVNRHPGLTVATAAAELHLAPNTVSTLVHLDVTDTSRTRMSGWRRRRLNAVAKAVNLLEPDERECLADAMAALAKLGENLQA